MEIIDYSLEGLKLIIPKVFKDERGYFFESYRSSLYQKAGIDVSFVQDNCAYSKKRCLRGMHYQTEPGQDKLVWVSRGMIFDVAVDIRPESETFGKWKSVVLDDSKKMQLFIPKGFAHGYLVLSDDAVVHYKVSSVYQRTSEKGFRYDDPEVGIDWPCHDPILSERDQNAPNLEELSLC